MHAQARRRVEFDDAAVLLFQRMLHRLAHHIDAADVHPDHARGGDHAGGHLGVHFVGDIGGGAAGREVGVVAQHHPPALLGNRVGFEPLGVQPCNGNVVKADPRERGGMAGAATRIGVDLVDQLAHRVHAVTHHQRGLAAGGGHQAIAHHQQPVVVARQVLLDHHRAVAFGAGIGRLEGFLVGDVDRHAFALVAILRLDHHRQADGLGRLPACFGVLDRQAPGHRHAGGVQQSFGQVLVLGDGFGNRAGGVGFGGLDATLPDAPAKLHQAAVGQAPVGDAACDRCIDDGPGRGPQAHILVECVQAGNGVFDVEALALQGCLAELAAQIESEPAHRLFGVLHHDLVDAGFLGGRGAAEGHRAAGLALQRQHHFLERVGHGGGFARPQGVDRPDGREDLPQPLFDRLVRGQHSLLGRAADDGFDGGVAAPQIGAAQGADAGNVHEG